MIRENTHLAERRQAERLPVNLGVNVAEPNLGLLPGRTIDVSRQGLKVELMHRLPIGCDITLNLALAEQTLGIAGRIRSVTEVAPDVFLHGVEFFAMNVEDRERFEAFLLGYSAADSQCEEQPERAPDV